MSTDALPWREVWDDLRVPLNTTRLGGAKDPGFVAVSGLAGDLRTFGFDAGIEEEVFFAAQLPHRYSTGTEIRPHVHWCSTSSTGAKKVKWGLAYAIQRTGRVLSTGLLSGLEAAPGKSTGGKPVVEITPLATSTGGRIAGTGVPPSAMILGRFYRDATSTADTYAADALALEVDFHYLVGHDGTTSELPPAQGS